MAKRMTKQEFIAARIGHELTQVQFAKVLFISERMVGHIESGTRPVSNRVENMVKELNSEIIKKRLRA